MRTQTIRTRVRDSKTGKVRSLKPKAPKKTRKRILHSRRKAPKNVYRRRNGKRVAGKRISRMV